MYLPDQSMREEILKCIIHLGFEDKTTQQQNSTMHCFCKKRQSFFPMQHCALLIAPKLDNNIQITQFMKENNVRIKQWSLYSALLLDQLGTS